MLAFSAWWAFRDGLVRTELNQGGVYEFCDAAGSVIYIGGTADMRRRLTEHLGEDANSCIRANAARYRVEYRLDYAVEASQRYDAFVGQNGRPPKCNDERPSP